MTKTLVLSIVLGLAALVPAAASPAETLVQSAGFGDDPPTRRNPADIENQLHKDDQVRESAFRVRGGKE